MVNGAQWLSSSELQRLFRRSDGQLKRELGEGEV
jgi:hypothetical protein